MFSIRWWGGADACFAFSFALISFDLGYGGGRGVQGHIRADKVLCHIVKTHRRCLDQTRLEKGGYASQMVPESSPLRYSTARCVRDQASLGNREDVIRSPGPPPHPLTDNPFSKNSPLLQPDSPGLRSAVPNLWTLSPCICCSQPPRAPSVEGTSQLNLYRAEMDPSGSQLRFTDCPLHHSTT